jgi:hypothetical protein
MKAVGVLVSLGVVAALGGCGGGGTSPSTGSPSPSTFAVSAAVSGLATGASLTLTDNGSDALTVTTNGTFTFGSKLASGAREWLRRSQGRKRRVVLMTLGRPLNSMVQAHLPSGVAARFMCQTPSTMIFAK